MTIPKPRYTIQLMARAGKKGQEFILIPSVIFSSLTSRSKKATVCEARPSPGCSKGKFGSDWKNLGRQQIPSIGLSSLIRLGTYIRTYVRTYVCMYVCHVYIYILHTYHITYINIPHLLMIFDSGPGHLEENCATGAGAESRVGAKAPRSPRRCLPPPAAEKWLYNGIFVWLL